MTRKKQRDFTDAEICLEKWVLWNTEHNGFPARSPILKLGEMPAFASASSIPAGVEPNDRDVERANTVLALMSGSSNKSAERAHILKVVTRERREGESIAKTIDRLDNGISKFKYYDSLEEFDIRLETLTYKRSAS